MSYLRKYVQELKETIGSFNGAASYPGPMPGEFGAYGSYYNPQTLGQVFGIADENQKKKFNDRFAKKRDKLKKLAIWLTQKQDH